MKPQDHPKFNNIREAMLDVLATHGAGHLSDDGLSWNLAAQAIDILTAPPATSVTQRNIAIAEALGLNPRLIRKGGVTITLDGDQGPLVNVEFSNFEGAVVLYKLVPLDEDET